MEKKFSAILLKWYGKNKRDLPWVGIKDPYLVWLSEIIMQQTRVEQGTAYYLKFATAFPSIANLANASEDEVLKMWEGLGYYSRARNMHFTAKEIMHLWAGRFPLRFEDIIKLKGVGKYTASAIVSYAYNQPCAVVDGNVFRVLARIFGIKLPFSGAAGKGQFEQLAQHLIDKKEPAVFNQAMMDFGSAICKPVNPDCPNCPFQKVCFAFQHGETGSLPVKTAKPARRNRYFHFLVFMNGNKVILEKRNAQDIWKNLYQFPMIEAGRLQSKNQLARNIAFRTLTGTSGIGEITEFPVIRQQLTHQKITAAFFVIPIKNLRGVCPPNGIIIAKKSLKDFAFPGVIRTFLPELSTFID